MSNRLAIAAVTATLQDRLTAAAAATEVTGVQVSSSRPETGRADAGPSINVFLYGIVVNPFLRNEQLPTRGADFTLVNEPLAALDLNYLVTFNGKDTTQEPQRLLGAAISNFSLQPILEPSEIQQSCAARNHLAEADLDTQVERVVLTPFHLSLEELSRLWSVLLHQPYALSMQYQASVVLVSSAGDPTPNAPARAGGLTVEPPGIGESPSADIADPPPEQAGLVQNPGAGR